MLLLTQDLPRCTHQRAHKVILPFTLVQLQLLETALKVHCQRRDCHRRGGGGRRRRCARRRHNWCCRCGDGTLSTAAHSRSPAAALAHLTHTIIQYSRSRTFCVACGPVRRNAIVQTAAHNIRRRDASAFSGALAGVVRCSRLVQVDQVTLAIGSITPGAAAKARLGGSHPQHAAETVHHPVDGG